MNEKVKAALESVRPGLQSHGGDVELVEVEESTGKVFVKLTGACNGCQGAIMTLKMGIERILKEQVPGVTEVINVDM